LRVLLRACRPRQWSKNILVALAPTAAGVLTRPRVVTSVAITFAALCLLASATYLVNDVRDREQDRHHPRKRLRPVAAGLLAPLGALRIAAVLGVLGISLALLAGARVCAVALGYLALTTSYSIWWRRIPLLDIAAVAGGFLLRAIAGGVAAGVPLSAPFLVVTSACALFIVAGKRYAELRRRPSVRDARASLARYSPRLLRLVLAGAAAAALVAYAQWALTRAPWSELSIVPFAMWLGRYALALGQGHGEAPEELVLEDPALLALALAWALLFLGGVYAGR
jgi:decaprenyl-phosphate phosphoribosyltransferase